MASIADSTLGSVLSRGFETYAAGDVCIKKHPNGLFVVTLAPSHPLAQRDAPVVTEVRFGADLCENEAYGKRCRGGANVNTKTLLAEVVSEAGSYTIRSPIEARLVELNSLLSEDGDPPTARRRFFPRGRGGGRFPRRRFRDALMAIVEEDDEEALPDELLEVLGEDSFEEDEEKTEIQQDMTEFAAAPHEAFVANQPESSMAASPLAEIYAQEYKARNRVREIKKMRQYFQKESPGGPTAARNEHVKKWVAEQQKKEPCFICHQLGHWSQECPYRKKVHSANVTFPVSRPQQEDWALLESLAAAGVYMVRDGSNESTLPHQVFWALDELDGKDHTKMIVDLGCMRTVAGTTWVNRVVQKWKRLKRYLKVVPEGEKFRFGDGQVVDSQFAVILEVDIAGIQALLRISVVHGNCPPLLSKPVCSELGFVIDTASHAVTSRRYGVKQFGLEQSKGGHYVIPIDEGGTEGRCSIDPDFEWHENKEICVLAGAIGSAIRDGTCDGPDFREHLAPATHGPERERRTRGLRVVAERMGDRWRWPRGRRGRDRADGGRAGIGGEDPTSDSSQEHNLPDGQEAYITESTGQEVREAHSSSRSITGEDEGDGSSIVERTSGHGQDASHVRADATMDDAAEIVAGGRGSGGGREAFQARISAPAVLLAQDRLARTVEEKHYKGGDHELANDPVGDESYAGAASVTANDPPEEYAMTMVDDAETGEFGRALNDELRSPVNSAAAPSFRKPLNRRQTRTLQQGVQRALQTHNKMFDVLDAKVNMKECWTLLEVFAGRARLSDLARRRGTCWRVLPPQDVLYGLDLLQEGELQLLKDVIRTQQPDVITLAPPMATVDEMEATRVTKEALQDLAKQLSSGRVNADILEDDIPEQPPEYQPDGRYPQMEFSDEEDSPEAPVGPDELRKATSVLDDVPMSVAQGVQSGRHSAPDRSTRRRVGPAPAEASSIRATVASSSADDPALRTVRQKRDFYEEAFKTTQEHLKKMKKKLEPQSTLIVKPVATSPEMEESEQSGEVEDALVFESNNPLVHPDPHPHWRGHQELAEDDPSHTSLVDIPKPPTGKIRLELQWSQLSPAWQQAFEDPIKDALDIYFKHDALTHVMPDEKILDEEVLPSRFVLVNKADPKNQHPEDSDLEEAKLKARLVIAGHKDQRAGDFETQAPTASLLSHNFLCFVAAQYKWRMFFADISAAFLQGDYLPEGRRVFIRSPKNYPMFVREFLMTKIPPGARTDLFRMKKAGFGLAESPRLWYQRFKRDIMSIGGRELALAPGVFSFCGPDGQIWALLAVHVDDVRLICSPRAEEDLWPSLKRLFTFGDWVHPKDFVKFCGRYEKQMEDFSVVIQMDEYGTKIKEPPVRAAGQTLEPLTPNERSWIGTIIGQVSWLARQVRGDLLFGCSRIQQLAGVGDASALQELKILVDRARVPRRQVFRHLGCDLETMVVLGVSDASFSGMPRGRSQGGSVLLVANPTILEGEARVNVLTFHSSLLKRVVRSSLAAEISQAATVMEEADFLRALMAEALDPAFQLRNWMASVAKWRQLAVLDSRTGYDLLNGTSLGEDKRLAIDVASMRQALQEDGAARAVRWVPGEEILADDLTKLIGNGRLMDVLEGGSWALKDTETAKQLRADAAPSINTLTGASGVSQRPDVMSGSLSVWASRSPASVGSVAPEAPEATSSENSTRSMERCDEPR
eukprot:g11757.t1